MTSRFLTALACAMLAPAAAFPLTLGEAVRETWERSPAVSGQIDAQRNLYRLSVLDRYRRLVPNEPSFNWSRNDDKTNEAIGLSETFAFPGKAFASMGLDAARARSQYAEWQARRHDAAKQATQNYTDCAGSGLSVDLLQATLSDLEGLARTLKVRYQSGQSTLAETISADLQIKQGRADLQAVSDKHEVSCRRLAQFVGRPMESTGAYRLPDDLDAEIVEQLAPWTADEDRSRGAREVAEAARKAALWAQLPDVTLSVVKNHYLYLPGSPNGSPYTYNYGLSVSLPILFPLQETVETKRARYQAQADRGAAEVQWRMARVDRRDAAREYQRSRKRLRELRENDLAMAQALMESTFTAYKTGKLGFAELVLNRKTLLDLRTQDIQLRASVINAHLRCLRECEAPVSPHEYEE